MNRLRFAFAGFRHGHIFSLYKLVKERADVELVAACEEDEKTRADLTANGRAAITHSSYSQMLDAVPADVVAIGDYYGKRGSLAIEALRRGKHVILDKPICTSLAELDQIEKLAREKKLVVGCQLDMRDLGAMIDVRKLIRGGEIGDVHAIFVGGQHPLMFGTRPGWYFETGKHGGTLNDIAIHAIDAIPWITGLTFRELVAARAWNARLSQVPFFQDAAQFMATLSNGCGLVCDVSYLSPDSAGYGFPQYWRMTFWGAKGLLETAYNAKEISVHRAGSKTAELLTPSAGLPGAYLESFLAQIRGEKGQLHLSAEEVFRASRLALRIQQAADKHQAQIALA